MSYTEERRVHESVLRDIERLETVMAVKYPDWAQPDFRLVKHGVQRNIDSTVDNAKIAELLDPRFEGDGETAKRF